MSNLAYARPLPVRQPAAQPRRVEIVTTRVQRRARPRAVYAVVTIGSLFLIFAAQLVLSIVVSDGAYQISTLQAEQKDLLRTQDALTERLHILESTQNLATQAAHLGMVPNASPFTLNLATGGVYASPGTVDPTGCGGACALITNSLLAGVPLVDPSTPAAATSTTTTTSTGANAPADPAVTSTLPSPVTH